MEPACRHLRRKGALRPIALARKLGHSWLVVNLRRRRQAKDSDITAQQHINRATACQHPVQFQFAIGALPTWYCCAQLRGLFWASTLCCIDINMALVNANQHRPGPNLRRRIEYGVET